MLEKGNSTVTMQQAKSTNASVDLEKAPIESVLQELVTDSQKGLTTTEAKRRLQTYGANVLATKEQSAWSKFIHHFMGPIAYMIEAAALVSVCIGHWDDFSIILLLLFFNAFIGIWQDHKASNALAALKKGLAPTANALRDGNSQSIPAADLVPGDIVKIRLGMVVPADLRLIGGDYASIDQAALTGESLPVSKKVGDQAYSGSIVKQGEMTAVVTSTGSNTFFGRTAKLVAGAGAQSHAERAMFQIGNFLIVVAVVLAAIMVAFRVYIDIFVTNTWSLDDALNILQFVLVLLVASIPVAMPTVFSMTLALGALHLSKEKAIVSKLSSLEEMAGVDILCSDKTGTLTKNQLTLGATHLVNAKDEQEIILAGSLASRLEDHDAIDTAVCEALKDKSQLDAWVVDKFVPFDPVSKRTEGQAHSRDGQTAYFTKGAPQVIVDLAHPDDNQAKLINEVVNDLAEKGFRALAVARSDDQGKTWKILGVLSMFDPPRDDSKATIEEVNKMGVSVKMITGDDTAIAKQIAGQLGLGTNILNAEDTFPKNMNPDYLSDKLAETIEQADGFARVFPEHKYAIVKTLQRRGHLVAMTGDGVNDAPALKQADCGTAVAGATDAARGAAALVLTAPGLSVIATAIRESRKIFERITAYTVYRVALTMTIMLLVVMASILYGFQPVTAIMIVVMSLIDDLPIISIAYDNADVDENPVRWNMPAILTESTVLGIFSIVQSMVLLTTGVYALHHIGDAANWFTITSQAELQTIMFLQLVSCGPLLLLVSRKSDWFFTPPFPAGVMLCAMGITQVFALCMCYFGWMVQAISADAIIAVWVYNLVWMCILGCIRVITSHFARK